MRAAFASVAVLLALAAAAPHAQHTFEVVSIRANTSRLEQMMIAPSPSGLVTATNVNVRTLVQYAYDVPEARILDEPDWTVHERFDISARGAAGADAATGRVMFKALLAERFALVVRHEQRALPVDILSFAEGGAATRGLTPSTHRCVPPARCGARSVFGRVDGVNATLAQLAQALTTATRRTVLDRTGDTGRYDFVLTYTPDAVTLQPGVAERFPAVDPDGESLATALREQLGIRMRSAREPLEVLVIARVARPSVE